MSAADFNHPIDPLGVAVMNADSETLMFVDPLPTEIVATVRTSWHRLHVGTQSSDALGFAILHDDGVTLTIVDPLDAAALDTIRTAANRVVVRVQFIGDVDPDAWGSR